MGTLVRQQKTIPLPAGATVGRNGKVMWTVGGKKRIGKLSKSGRVNIQTETWMAQYTDETGKVKRVSTKTKNRSAAEKILAQMEAEVDRIKSGVVSREELAKAKLRHTGGLDEALEQFRTKMVAGGNTKKYIDGTMQQVLSLLHETRIDAITKLRRETIERWIADKMKKGDYTPRTINHYITAVQSFAQYLTDIDLLPSNPLKSIKKLNPEIGQKKKRRALTTGEVERLLKAAEIRKYRRKNKGKEKVLIYRLLIGTGLRSTELSLLTPNQIDFDRFLLRVEAAKTKNKKADVLPLRPDLVQAVKEWVDSHGIQANERIFHYNRDSIRRSFYGDLKAAGIERKDSDGRSIDVHSLRKTFGTLLALAGVPLTTVQRLMRHSTPTLTAKLYIDVDPINMMEALGKLPDFYRQPATD